MKPFLQNIQPSLGTVTTPYGGMTKYEGFHKGVDVANKKGTPIPAFASGVVTKVMNGLSMVLSM